MNRRVALAGVLVAAAFAGTARAAFTPAWSYVPAGLRAQLAQQDGGTLYLPARTPSFYRYRSGAKVTGATLTVPFTNRVRIRAGVWQWTKQAFTWQVAPYAASRACTAYDSVAKTLQVDGNKVYSNGNGTTWRCVVDAKGRGHVLVAKNGGALPDVALATVVASGLDVSKRTAAATLASVVIREA